MDVSFWRGGRGAGVSARAALAATILPASILACGGGDHTEPAPPPVLTEGDRMAVAQEVERRQRIRERTAERCEANPAFAAGYAEGYRDVRRGDDYYVQDWNWDEDNPWHVGYDIGYDHGLGPDPWPPACDEAGAL